jgi:excisionase family DNA binding protein
LSLLRGLVRPKSGQYATKSTGMPGLPDTRIRTAAAITALRCSARHKRMIATAWQLGSVQATGDARLRLWAHTLGYGGHFLTKSRRYSVTFGQLRRARAEHRRLDRHGDDDGVRDPWGRPLDETVVLVVNDWTYAGCGYASHTSALSSRLHQPIWHADMTIHPPHDPASPNRRRTNAMTLVSDRLTGADPRVLLTVEEAARRLNIGRTTMYSLVSNGAVEFVTIGRLRRLPSECLDNFVAALRSSNRPETTAA